MNKTAIYSGTCRKCGMKISVGDQIDWERSSGARHIVCPEKAPQDPDIITVSRGSGYPPYRPFSVGETFRRGDKILTVKSTSQSYYHDDGLCFGVGDDSGYIYYADCRPATEGEIEKLIAAEQASEDHRRNKSRLDEIERQIRETGIRPQEQPKYAEVLFGTFDIYGGGERYVIDDERIWYIRNNGMDGDSWDNNNIRTGGAGAIGWCVPYTEELAQELRELHEQICSYEESQC